MNSPRCRRGTTLIEIMATLSVLLVLGIATAKLLTSVTRIGFHANERKTSIAMIERLANDFRRDVALSQSISIDQQAESIDLVAGSMAIQYAFDAQTRTIQRTENFAAKLAADKKRLERYRLTARCQPKFVADDTLVTLQLVPKGQPNPWTIQAAKP